MRAQLSDLDAKIRMLESAANNPIITTIKEYSSKYAEFESELIAIKSRLAEMQEDITQTTLVSRNTIESILDPEYAEKYSCFIDEWSRLISDYLVLQERITSLRELAEELYVHHSHHLSAAFEDAKTQYSQTILELKQQGINDIDELDSLYFQRSKLQERIDEILYWKSELEEISKRKSSQFDAIIAHQQYLRDERSRIISSLNSDQVRITLLPR